MAVETWNKIVDLFNENKESLERELQSLWENIFSDAEFFGYSKVLNEVESQRVIKIGSKERTIPDIIIRDSKSDKDLFVIELKQSSLSIGEEQLFSYLKLLKLEIGILIADKIYVYAYDYNKDDRKQSLVTIPFEKGNIEGVKFIQLFSKGSFSLDSVREYINSSYESLSEIIKIRKEISPDLLKELATKYFNKKYDAVSVEKALDDLKISIINLDKSKVLEETDFSNAKDLDKSQIRLICKQQGMYLPENLNHFVKAKLNVSGTKKYWANPDVARFQEDLWLILEDPFKRELHVFFIAANSIIEKQLVMRKDKQNQIDLQISYNDINFTDTKSSMVFRKWYLRSIQY